MPIKPENKKLYPKNWSEIRENILARAGNCCEFCGVENGRLGWRGDDGQFHDVEKEICYYDQFGEKAMREARAAFKIVLTIANLDHNPTNNDPSNLQALCQKCHNKYDASHRSKNARKTRRDKKAWKGLFE
jgi:5-methylcytosine-specific restriction endonuclease McrA